MYLFCFKNLSMRMKLLKLVILYYVEHDLRAKGKFYAPNLTPFQELYKSCRHLLTINDITF